MITPKNTRFRTSSHYNWFLSNILILKCFVPACSLLFQTLTGRRRQNKLYPKAPECFPPPPAGFPHTTERGFAPDSTAPAFRVVALPQDHFVRRIGQGLVFEGSAVARVVAGRFCTFSRVVCVAEIAKCGGCPVIADPSWNDDLTIRAHSKTEGYGRNVIVTSRITSGLLAVDIPSQDRSAALPPGSVASAGLSG